MQDPISPPEMPEEEYKGAWRSGGRGRPPKGVDYEPTTSVAPIKKWKPRHQHIINLHVFEGKSNVEIAEIVGVTPQTVYNILRDPQGRRQIKEAMKIMADLSTNLQERFKLHSHEAVDVHVEVMRDSPKDDLRLKAAQNILDRAGHTPIQKKVELKGEIPADPALLSRLQKVLEEVKDHNIQFTPQPRAPEPEEEIVEAEFEVENDNDDAD